jgi:hypothetical protein
MTASTRIYQASDLNQNGRAILDAARDSVARVRDKDGTSPVMLSEERLQALSENAEASCVLAMRSRGACDRLQPPEILVGAIGHPADSKDTRRFPRRLPPGLPPALGVPTLARSLPPNWSRAAD